MNPCSTACKHFRFVQGVVCYCVHPRLVAETFTVRTHFPQMLSAKPEEETAEGRTIETFPRRGAPLRTEPPVWCPARGDWHCPRCRSVYLDAHPTTAAEHHAAFCPEPLEAGDAPSAE